MNYELAKELKDAGFPQKDKGQFVGDPKVLDGSIYSVVAVYVPTLSELIEFCVIGGRAIMLRNDARTVAWHVSSGLFAGNGVTSEEAVARLWLALNQSAQ